MECRIYRPSRTAMQSGRAKTKKWVLEFEPAAAKEIDDLMGWTGSRDTRRQVVLRFASREEAIAYARRHGFAYTLSEPRERAPKAKAYADNFAFDRVV